MASTNGQLRGSFFVREYAADRLSLCIDVGGRRMTPADAERAAGLARNRKWKVSLLCVSPGPGGPPIKLGTLLQQLKL